MKSIIVVESLAGFIRSCVYSRDENIYILTIRVDESCLRHFCHPRSEFYHASSAQQIRILSRTLFTIHLEIRSIIFSDCNFNRLSHLVFKESRRANLSVCSLVMLNHIPFYARASFWDVTAFFLYRISIGLVTSSRLRRKTNSQIVKYYKIPYTTIFEITPCHLSSVGYIPLQLDNVLVFMMPLVGKPPQGLSRVSYKASVIKYLSLITTIARASVSPVYLKCHPRERNFAWYSSRLEFHYTVLDSSIPVDLIDLSKSAVIHFDSSASVNALKYFCLGPSAGLPSRYLVEAKGQFATVDDILLEWYH